MNLSALRVLPIFSRTLLCILCTLFSVTTDAAAPMVRTQAPGFYRMMLGDFEVTALNDGVVTMAVIFPGMSSEEINARLADRYLTSPIGMSFNAFLVNTGDKLILIDAGAGDVAKLVGWTAGHLIENLRTAGYRPEQVDEVYITHMHPDHIGGLILAGQRAFPGAVVRAASKEVERYLDAAKMASALASSPDEATDRIRFQRVRTLLEPYINAGKFLSFDGDVTLVPGIRALATHGHTPGHTSYVVESGEQTLIVIGDLIHHAAVQFPNPWFPAATDWDPKEANAERVRIFQQAADRGFWIAGAHISFPGIGHVRSDRGAYLWVPANYEIPANR